jgi:hypothetical protein
MALPANSLAFGLRDVGLTPLGADGETPGTKVDLPASRTLSFQEGVSTEELRGDDALLALRDTATQISWSLESGGISIAAIKVITGGTVTTSGTTPNQKSTLNKKGTDNRPYFKIEGQVISDSGGDVHAVIYKCKAEGDVGGEFSEGSFFLTGASGRGIARGAGDIWDLVQNETAVAIP